MNLKRDNIILDNPVLVASLGFVSVLTATVTLKSAILMSLAVFLVLLFSSIVTSALKKLISEDLETITLLVIIVAFASVAQMVLQFYYPTTVSTMGIGIFLISVNSLILNRLQSHAIGASVGEAIKDSITSGIGYFIVMVVMGIVRELFGLGTIFGFRIIPERFIIPTFSTPIFGFIILGLLVAFSNWNTRRIRLKGRK